MREIKFRQYYRGDDDTEPEWNSFDLRNGHMIVDGGWENPQQFTGLTDRNGVEIYEGDLLALKTCPSRHTGCTCEKKAHPDFTGPVVYEGRSFECYEVGSDWSLYEVIGNIYENPELIQK